MKNDNHIEIILFSKYSAGDLHEKELLRWLETTAQPVIDRQWQKAKKLFPGTLTDTPAIYLS